MRMSSQIEPFMKQVAKTVPLVEHFYSFQGEGRYAGVPSIFIRLGGCNLGCKGFGVEIDGVIGCDSLKAVHEKQFGDRWERVDDLVAIVESYLQKVDFLPDLVITGGEPLLHYSSPVLLELLEFAIEKGMRVTFETNATIGIDFTHYPLYKEVIFAMSVKLKNSGEAQEKRFNNRSIGAIVENAKESFFKFVVRGEAQEREEIEMITEAFRSVPIYCMPMGSTAEELARYDKAVAQFCIQNGYRYVDRMHIRLWSNEEGR